MRKAHTGHATTEGYMLSKSVQPEGWGATSNLEGMGWGIKSTESV